MAALFIIREEKKQNELNKLIDFKNKKTTSCIIYDSQ